MNPMIGLMFVCKKLIWKGREYDSGKFYDSHGLRYIVTFMNDEKAVFTDSIHFSEINQTEWLFYDPLVSSKEGALKHLNGLV